MVDDGNNHACLTFSNTMKVFSMSLCTSVCVVFFVATTSLGPTSPQPSSHRNSPRCRASFSELQNTSLVVVDDGCLVPKKTAVEGNGCVILSCWPKIEFTHTYLIERDFLEPTGVPGDGDGPSTRSGQYTRSRTAPVSRQHRSSARVSCRFPISFKGSPKIPQGGQAPLSPSLLGMARNRT